MPSREKGGGFFMVEAFNHQHEERRLSEEELDPESARRSMELQLWSLLAERSGSLNPFPLEANLKTGAVTAVGFDHRGSLDKTYQKSVEEAENELVARRYNLENKGYEEAKKFFFELPFYSTVVLFSPPPSSDMRHLGYSGNSMVYFYHILPGENENKRTIKSLSWMNGLDMDDLSSIANNLLGSQLVKPTEESIFSNPIGVYGNKQDKTASVKEIWNQVEDYYQKSGKSDFLPSFKMIEEYLLKGQEIRQREYADLSLVVEEVARLYRQGAFDEDFQSKWRIMLNLADKLLLHRDITESHTQEKPVIYDNTALSQFGVFGFYRDLDHETRTVSGSCGSSGGDFKNPLASLLKKFVLESLTFEVERSSTDEISFTCPSCHKTTKGPVGEECPKCHITLEEWKRIAAKKGEDVCN